MPRKKKPKLTEAQELAQEFAGAKKELERAEKLGTLFRKRHIKKARAYLSRLVGYDRLIIAHLNTPNAGEILDRAIPVYAAELAKVERRKIERKKKYQARLRAKGLSKIDIARAIMPIFRPKPRPIVKYFQIPYGRGKGKWIRLENNRRVGKFKTTEQVRRAHFNELRENQITAMANKLLISKKAARAIYTGVRKAALRDLKEFKKTKGFKGLPPRRQKLYTAKRWARANLATLWKLLEVEWSP